MAARGWLRCEILQCRGTAGTIWKQREQQLKALRPLKSKLAELEKRHRELSEAVKNCVEAIKKKGANSITDDFMVEAERLSVEKRSIELEKGKVQIEITYRENVVADKQRIADALLRFESVVKNLPADDQKDLVQLIVREISVKHFDPSTDAAPKQPGVFKTQIRTKWFLVNMSVFAGDLIPDGSGSGEISSDLKRIGSAGVSQTRTYWDLCLTVGIPFSR